MTPVASVTGSLGAELAELALRTARMGAELVRARAAAGVTVAATKSSEVDVVTQADRDCEQLVRRLLREARPDDGLLGEEEAESSGTSGIRWVVDPIDGTVNFLYGIPQYAVSIAAERLDGGGGAETEVLAGVVVNAATGTEYVAHVAADGTATVTRDGEPIGVRGPAPLSQRLVGTGFHYDAQLRGIQARAMVDLLPRVRDIRRQGSCALDLCHVAEGTLDAYVEEGVNLWDHAAGGLVARAAGARTELTTGAGGRDLMICAPEHGFAEFRSAVAEAGFVGGATTRA